MGDTPIREYNIKIDIITGKVQVLDIPRNQNIEFVKGDFRSNQLNIQLVNKDKPYTIGDNHVKIVFSRYDKELVILEKGIHEVSVVDNIVECILTEDILEITGRQVQVQIIIYDIEGRRLTSAKFSFYVVKGLLDATKIKQVSGYDLFAQLTSNVENLINHIEQIIMPEEQIRIDTEELRVLAEEGRVSEFNAKLEEIRVTTENAINQANFANEKALLASEATDTINQTNQALILVEQQRDAIFNDLVALANLTKDNLNAVIIIANDKNNELIGTIINANNSKDALDDSIALGNSKATELNNMIITSDDRRQLLNNATSTANDKKFELEQTMINAENKKNEIDNPDTGAIKRANDSKVALEGVITNSITTKNNIEDDIDVAVGQVNTSKQNLQNTIDDANDTINLIENPVTGTIKKATDSKTALEGAIINAGTAKSNLESRIDEADLLKQDIEQAIINNQIVKQDEFEGQIANKVDKIAGKGLSVNDYTNEEKQKNEDNAIKIGVLSTLKTTEKANLVGSVNEVKDELTNLNTKYEAQINSDKQSPIKNITFNSIGERITSIEQQQQQFHYNHVAQEYINVDKYWDSLRTGKIYTTEFYQFNVSPTPTGVKKDDNKDLICEPSTNTVRGRNDYENIGLFMSFDVNAYVDENGDYHVTAIKGDGRFANDGTMGDVYVMAMPGYQKRYSDDNVWGVSYSDTMHPGFEILDEAVKPDGTIRPYLLHAKYIAGRNPHENNNLASISGVPAEYNGMSHNGQITEFNKKGIQYSGKTSHDDYYVQMMFWLKYATTHSQLVMYGATSGYYLQYDNLVAEAGVNRVIITNAQANKLLIGSTVSIGDYDGSTKSTDRQTARNYNLAERVLITEIEDLGDGNSAVYVDAPAFNTSLTTTITTYPWNSGSCDNVLGQDGSPSNNLSGKEPFIINGIEMMVGGYEVLQNLIISNNSVDNRIDAYANYDCTTYATSPTANYDLVGQIVSTDNTWKYISKVEIKPEHPSVILPIEAEASSTTGFADGVYSNPPSTGGTRVWLSLGRLIDGAAAGARCLSAAVALSAAYWFVLGRLSATGQSRRRAGVN